MGVAASYFSIEDSQEPKPITYSERAEKRLVKNTKKSSTKKSSKKNKQKKSKTQAK